MAIKQLWRLLTSPFEKGGLREKYLGLRLKKLVLGADYYDLSMFYWDEGNRSKALSVAEEGMKKGKGRMDELRKFLSDRALEGGNREQYLQLQFDQAADHLTLENYKKFKQICTEEEWQFYEPKLLEKLTRAWTTNQLDILMHRKDYEKALQCLSRRSTQTGIQAVSRCQPKDWKPAVPTRSLLTTCPVSTT
jgi:hypothetical protein